MIRPNDKLEQLQESPDDAEENSQLHPNDHALREFIRRLDVAYTRKFYPRLMGREYVDLAVRSREPLVLKLKFYAYVLTPPFYLLTKFEDLDSYVEEIGESVEVHYIRTFHRWWKEFIFGIANKYSNLTERHTELKRLLGIYPKEMYLHDRLRKDFILAMNAYIQEVELQINGLPPLITPLYTPAKNGTRKVTGGGEKTRSLVAEGCAVEWSGPVNHLVQMFDVLFEEGKITERSYAKRFDLMHTLFAKPDGTSFSRPSLAQSERNNLQFNKNGPRGFETLDQKLRKMKTLDEVQETR